jgi:4-hydroxybenzoate polyprenyltransferase
MESLQIAGWVLIVVNLILWIVGFFPQFRQSKVWRFFSVALAFAAAVFFGALAVVHQALLPLLLLVAAMWFISGSLGVAYALWSDE